MLVTIGTLKVNLFYHSAVEISLEQPLVSFSLIGLNKLCDKF